MVGNQGPDDAPHAACQSEGAAQINPMAQWSCPGCTLLNNFGNVKCCLCQTMRPEDAVPLSPRLEDHMDTGNLPLLSLQLDAGGSKKRGGGGRSPKTGPPFALPPPPLLPLAQALPCTLTATPGEIVIFSNLLCLKWCLCRGGGLLFETLDVSAGTALSGQSQASVC